MISDTAQNFIYNYFDIGLTLERKIQLLDLLKQEKNVSEFARQHGLKRHHIYKLKRQEQEIRAAMSSASTSKPRKHWKIHADSKKERMNHKPGTKSKHLNAGKTEIAVSGASQHEDSVMKGRSAKCLGTLSF